MQKVSIIGTGNAGCALALALKRRGVQIDSIVTGRTGTTALDLATALSDAEVRPLERIGETSAEVIFIAVSDGSIQEIAETLARETGEGLTATTVFHLSGALPASILESVREKGASIGSLHPLLSISDPVRGSNALGGAYWTVEGDDKAKEAGKKIVQTLGARCSEISADVKVLYHAAAVMTCGHLVALNSVASKLLQECGLDVETARVMLTPLIESTVENMKSASGARALTGPFSRMDVETVRRHLTELNESEVQNALEIYRILGLESLSMIEGDEEVQESIDRVRNLILLDKTRVR